MADGNQPATRLANTLSAELSVSQDHAKWLITDRPELQQFPPSVLRLKIQVLAELFHSSKSRTSALVIKHPRILDAPVQTLSGQLQAVALTLQLSVPEVAAAVCNAPELVLHRPSDIRRRLEAIATILDLSLAEVGKLGLGAPRLFSITSKHLQFKLTFLQKTFHLDSTKAQRLVLRHPPLISMSEAGVLEKLAMLRDSLRLSDTSALQIVLSCPTVLSYATDRMQQHIGQLSSIVPLPQLQRMVTQEPTLITRPAELIIQRLQLLKELLACGRTEVLELVTRRPSLLTRSAETVSRSMRALSIWQFSVALKMDLVREHPLLLRMSPSEVHFRCRWLRQLVMGNGYFHNTIRSLPPALLGIIIMHLPTCWGRLAYLADSNQESTVRIMAVVQGADVDFQARFPGYDKWLQWQRKDMEGPVPWRCARFVLKHSREKGVDPRFVLDDSHPRQPRPSVSIPAPKSSAPPPPEEPLLAWPFQHHPPLPRQFPQQGAGGDRWCSHGCYNRRSSNISNRLAIHRLPFTQQQAAPERLPAQNTLHPQQAPNSENDPRVGDSTVLRPALARPVPEPVLQASAAFVEPARVGCDASLITGSLLVPSPDPVLQAASNQEKALQQDALPPNINKFLVPVDVWELKKIRKTSSLCALTYGMSTLTPRSLRRRHNLELLSTSWTCQLRQYEHSRTAEEVLAEGDGMSVSITDRYPESSGSSPQSQSPFSKSAPALGSSAMSLPYQTAPSSLPAPPPTVSPAEVLSTVIAAFPAAVLNAPTSTPAPSPASLEPLPSTSPTEPSRQSAGSSEPSRPTGPQLQLLVPPPLLNWKTPGDMVALKLGDAAAAASAAAAAVSAAAAIPFNSAAETLYAGLSVWPLTSVPKPPGWPVSLPATAAAVAAVAAEGREAFAAGGQREGGTDLAPRNGASPGSALVVSNPGSSTSSVCPSEWFVCDDVSTTTRYFVVQGSDTFDHWRVNLTFDPVLFEDPAWGVKVHRGAYDAAKVLYDVFLPMVYEHLESSPFAQVSFTGHSIGGSLATLLMLMYVRRGVLSQDSLATVYTFGAPAVFCQGGDGSSFDTLEADSRLAHTGSGSGGGGNGSRPLPTSPLPDQSQLFSKLGLHNSIIRNIVMHRDIVPRAFTCDYSLVTDVLKGWGNSFREQYGLNRHGRKHLYYVLGKMMVLQPDLCHPFTSPEGELPMLPPGPELYALVTPSPLESMSSSRRRSESASRLSQSQRPQGREVRSLVEAVLELMDNPHPLAILGDRGAYMDSGSISRYHNPDNYTRAFGRLIHLKRTQEQQRAPERPTAASSRSAAAAAAASASAAQMLDGVVSHDVSQWEGSDADDALLNPCFVTNVTPSEQHHC
ncbi:MAG: hypothetical protein WDW38_008376 [Sanguina aurantia]